MPLTIADLLQFILTFNTYFNKQYWKKKANELKINFFLIKSCYLFSQINMLAKIRFKIKCLLFDTTTVSGKNIRFDRMKIIP